MNRRVLFRTMIALSGASVIAPEILTDALPTVETLTSDITITVTIQPVSVSWPTYAEVLQNMLTRFSVRYGDVLVPGTADYRAVESLAKAVFEHQNMMLK